MRSLFILVTIFTIALSLPGNLYAISNPKDVANNRFGIHILQKSDIIQAESLVNSSGGEWGYVTLVIQENDRDIKKWQDVFDELRRKKLIPIVRIATQGIGNEWKKPLVDDASAWADFLGGLRWVVKNRYVVLFNEPNHAKEWQGDLAPSEYATVAKAFHVKLKNKSADFFVLPAGFDMAAGNTKETMEATNYWKAMQKADSTIFTIFDGWTSHSYPNPQFSSDPFDVGRQSIRSYQGEIAFLEQLGLKTNIPIFITETGWIHKEGKSELPEAFDAQELASHFQKAYESAWNDERVIAVTPFVLKYPNPPFDHFSWIKENGEPYPFYFAVQNMPKKKGQPAIENSISIEKDPLPEELISDSTYEIEVFVKNTGQAIWNQGEITFKGISHSPSPYLEPGQSGKLTIIVKTQEKQTEKKVTLQPQYKDSAFGESLTKTIRIVPPTSLKLTASTFPKINSLKADNFILVIYDGVRFIKEIKGITFEDGMATVLGIHDLIPGQLYRFVLVYPHYLPVQTVAHLSLPETQISFPRMLPLDPNGDGALTLADIPAVITHPIAFMQLIWPFGL